MLSGGLSLDLFAAKLRLVVEGTAPQVYRDTNKLFAHTFATDGIKTLIREVLGRLMKQSAGAGWDIEIMKVADLTYLLVPRLCLGTHIRRLCLQLIQAANETLPRLHRFPGRALGPVKSALVLSQKFID